MHAMGRKIVKLHLQPSWWFVKFSVKKVHNTIHITFIIQTMHAARIKQLLHIEESHRNKQHIQVVQPRIKIPLSSNVNFLNLGNTGVTRSWKQ